MALRVCCVQLRLLPVFPDADAKDDCARALADAAVQATEAVADETEAAQTRAVTFTADDDSVNVDAASPAPTGFKLTTDGNTSWATNI